MPKEQRKKEPARPPEDSPVVWFAVLERAKRTNDFDLAAQARRELVRLGVKVSFLPSVGQRGCKGVQHVR
jgi:hypothetical protein